MTFSEKLRLLRKRANLTQSQLADELGITTRTLINYEMGRCCPKNSEIYMKLAEYFDIDMAELINDAELTAAESPDGEPIAQKEMRNVIARMNALFAGGELSDEDRDKVMFAVTDMYWKAKAKKQ